MATKREIERIAVLEEKVDNLCNNLDDHIIKQDKFEEKILATMQDFGLVLKAFKVLGWLITVGVGTAIVWITNHYLNRG